MQWIAGGHKSLATGSLLASHVTSNFSFPCFHRRTFIYWRACCRCSTQDCPLRLAPEFKEYYLLWATTILSIPYSL